MTYGSSLQDFSGSHAFLVHMIWSPTPAVLRRLATSATPVLPSANLSSLGTRNEVYFVAQYRPCALAVYAWPRPLPVWTQDSLRGLRRGATSVELSSTGDHELLLSHSDFDH
jgi:hypothetical protein